MEKSTTVNFMAKLTMVTCCMFYASGYELYSLMLQMALLLSITHSLYSIVSDLELKCDKISIGLDLAILTSCYAYSMFNGVTLEVAFILAVLMTLKAFTLWVDHTQTPILT